MLSTITPCGRFPSRVLVAERDVAGITISPGNRLEHDQSGLSATPELERFPGLRRQRLRRSRAATIVSKIFGLGPSLISPSVPASCETA